MSIEGTRKVIFIPTMDQKKDMNKRCSKAIDCFTGLQMEEKAFALKMLLDSFEDLTGIKISDIKINE